MDVSLFPNNLVQMNSLGKKKKVNKFALPEGITNSFWIVRVYFKDMFRFSYNEFWHIIGHKFNLPKFHKYSLNI